MWHKWHYMTATAAKNVNFLAIDSLKLYTVNNQTSVDILTFFGFHFKSAERIFPSPVWVDESVDGCFNGLWLHPSKQSESRRVAHRLIGFLESIGYRLTMFSFFLFLKIVFAVFIYLTESECERGMAHDPGSPLWKYLLATLLPKVF